MDIRTSGIGGLALGVVVVAWQLVSAGTGLLALFVPVAMLLQIATLVLTLWRTRSTQSYGTQVASGAVVSAIASGRIFLGSLVPLPLVYPDLFESLGASPLNQAIAGVVGTMITGVFGG